MTPAPMSYVGFQITHTPNGWALSRQKIALICIKLKNAQLSAGSKDDFFPSAGSKSLPFYPNESSTISHAVDTYREAVNGASMCNCQLLNFLILICGHIRKCFSHHYCVNI